MLFFVQNYWTYINPKSNSLIKWSHEISKTSNNIETRENFSEQSVMIVVDEDNTNRKNFINSGQIDHGP